MATWFVDTTNGSNSNDGTAAATGGGHGPYATIAKAIGASGSPAGGDTVYIAPGIYRESVTLGVTPASELKIIGDVRRSQAWAASTPNGPVIFQNWTTDDFTTHTGANLLTINGKAFLSFQNIWFLGASARLVDATTTGSAHLKFQDCCFSGRLDGGNFAFDFTGTANVDPDILFERCCFAEFITSIIQFTCPTHTADYTANITIRNCFFLQVGGSQPIVFTTSGALAGKPGGAKVSHCTLVGGSSVNLVNAAGSWQTGTVKVEANLVWMAGLTAGTGGLFACDNNRLFGGAIGVATAGKNDRVAHTYLNPMYLEFGQSFLWGGPPRPFMAAWPVRNSFAAAFGEGTISDATDFLNRPRPSGAGVASSAASVTGTATAGAATTLTDSGAAWTTNAFIGYVLTITGGTGNGQRRWIKSNTATVQTIDQAWTTTPDATSTYSVDPPGALKACGYAENHEVYLPGGAANADGGTGNCLEILGPGDVKIRVSVPASAVTITVKVKWDSNHGDTNKPRAIMLGQPAIGVAATEDAAQNWHESKTATGTAGSGYETLTFSSITPTAAGWVEILLQSRSAKGHGIVFWDSWGGV